MSELPPNPSDHEADNPTWTRGRIILAAAAVFLIVILILAVLVSMMPTICCTVFSNVVNSL
jgi:hypothetical protein